MLKFLVRAFHMIDSKLYFFLNRKKVKNTTFTIISDNCWAGYVYQDLKIQYQTPFIGLFLFPECYVKLVKNFKTIIQKDVLFIAPEHSKYASVMNSTYPVGIIDDDIEIHFLHYDSQEEALEKWNRRKKRINMNNLFFKISCRNPEQNLSVLTSFQNLKNNKIIFTGEQFPGAIYYPELQTSNEKYTYHKRIDIISYLNNLG